MVNYVFSKGYAIASKYVKPVIVSVKTLDDTVFCSSGAFVLLNDEGWILTAAHIFELSQKFVNDEPVVNQYNNAVAAIQKDASLSLHNKKAKLSKIKKDGSLFTHCSYWWGNDGVRLVDTTIFPDVDLAIGRLDPFIHIGVGEYALVKNPVNIKPGTSLCRLGFPFHDINGTFDVETNSFILADDALPMPFFPIEGIYTRNIVGGKSLDGKYDIKFLETSSPGLRGQSGGPIFDVNGVLWAIQSRTNHLPLGFSPVVKVNGKDVIENQFLNVGHGVHPEVIDKILSEKKIDFKKV